MLRGLVLVIMALDHVRDMATHPLSTDYSAAVDFTGSAAAWFFTRWVTHICAPTFVLLAGVSAYLYGATRQRSTGEVARFLATRGVWLVFIELTAVNFAWSFNLHTCLLAGDLDNRMLNDRALLSGLVAQGSHCGRFRGDDRGAQRTRPHTTGPLRSFSPVGAPAHPGYA
jgi:hypothetical protein